MQETLIKCEKVGSVANAGWKVLSEKLKYVLGYKTTLVKERGVNQVPASLLLQTYQAVIFISVNCGSIALRATVCSLASTALASFFQTPLLASSLLYPSIVSIFNLGLRARLTVSQVTKLVLGINSSYFLLWKIEQLFVRRPVPATENSGKFISERPPEMFDYGPRE